MQLNVTWKFKLMLLIVFIKVDDAFSVKDTLDT